jgi:hypothetical protein
LTGFIRHETSIAATICVEGKQRQQQKQGQQQIPFGDDNKKNKKNKGKAAGCLAP